MDRIFHHDDTIFEAATKIYVKSGNGYVDSDCKVAVTADQMQDIFNRGMIIVDGSVQYLPVSLSVASNKATVTYVKTNSSTATTADLATVKSA